MSKQEDESNPSQSAKTPSAEAKAPELVPPALDNVLEAAGVDLKNPEVTKALEISMSFMVARGSLPLPPPELLAEYERQFPGLGQKLSEWTEQQRQHRQDLERKQVDGAERRMDRGQLIAAAVALVGLVTAGAVGILGNPWAAGVIAIVSIGGPTAAIWLARTMNGRASATASAPPLPQHRPSEPERL